MENDVLKGVRKLSQQYAYTSIQMHEAIARKAGLSGTDHKYRFIKNSETSQKNLLLHFQTRKSKSLKPIFKSN